MMNKETIFEQGSKYANENWNATDKPNEHDNAREDFIAGALWVVKHVSGSASSEKLFRYCG